TDRVKSVATPPQWQGPRRGRVAVIGSGPAGLTAAYFLAMMGREVKVFEALDVLGGMLAVGVPDYRLPREVLERDIEYIRRAGVEMETGRRVDSIQSLRDAGYDAVCVAAGAHSSYRLDIPGEDSDGVHDAITFLRQVAMGEGGEMPGRVAVVGGGNAAIDAARTALRLGAESVTLLYRRTREEMPAIREEIEEAVIEGVDLRFLVTPIEILAENGRVRAVRCAEMELAGADESGRRRPIRKEGAEQSFEADSVIVAVGQQPELRFAAGDGHLVVSRGRAVADPVTQHAGGDVFVGGDAVTGPATIVEAIAAGQRAAQAIDVFLGGEGELPADKGFASPGKPEPDESPEAARRRTIRTRSPRKRTGDFDEVTKGYARRAACAEARRCLRCDLEQ
ncbi:MAG: FAD-dependent oxidoreductase, partial [Planctomycetota bacterium]|nr:FAD-dependent oxidoreductase [Planctomycetota bacterium]